MASITIRNLEEPLKVRLRVRAASHGRSMEEEAREILRSALNSEPRRVANLAAAIRARFAPLRGVELPETPRGPMRETPRLDERNVADFELCGIELMDPWDDRPR